MSLAVRAAVGDLGKIIAAHVIARPHADIISLLPKCAFKSMRRGDAP